MKTIKYILGTLVIAASLSACVKDLDVIPIDPNANTADKALVDEAAFQSLLAGVYTGYACPGYYGKDGSPSLSGIENRCKKMLDQGEPPEDIAKFCLESVAISLEKMTEALLEKKKLPLLYAGGVMSNTMIRERFTERFGAFFAPPALSSDNAAGTAIIGFLKHERE